MGSIRVKLGTSTETKGSQSGMNLGSTWCQPAPTYFAVEAVRARAAGAAHVGFVGTSSRGQGRALVYNQVSVIAFHGIGSAFWNYFGDDHEASVGARGCLGWGLVSETAQVEVRSGRV
jgi:hypothetical protein